MRPSAQNLLLLVWCALSGCDGGTDYGYAVRVNLNARASLSNDALSAVRTLIVEIAGAENGTRTLPVHGFSSSRQERFLYRPLVAGGDVTLRIVANDVAGTLLARGEGTVTLVPGKTVLLEIDLGVDGDMGAPPFGVTPTVATVGRNGDLTFGASRAVTWAVVESTGGTIDASGHYHAPAVPGIFHLTATASDDPTLAVAIVITVGFNQLTVVAGAPGGVGNLDAVGTDARFSFLPFDCMLAAGPNGVLYAADRGNQLIRKIDSATGQVSTVAGVSGVAGSTDGPAGSGVEAATFHDPWGLAIDAAGNTLYVSDSANNTIRKIDLTHTPAVVSTLTGAPGQTGYADSQNPVQVRFSTPLGLALDADHGLLYVAEYGNNRVRSVVLSSGATSTLAGDGVQASVDTVPGPVRFSNPVSLSYDGALYVTDQSSAVIRKIVLSPVTVTTIAGTAGVYGNSDGTGAAASFKVPNGLSSSGNLLVVADRSNGNLRSIDKTSFVVTTLAGPTTNPPTLGYVDGRGLDARFDDPSGVVFSGGNLFVLDTANLAVRKVTAPLGGNPQVATLAGLPFRPGTNDGAGNDARINFAQSMVVVGARDVYFSDWENHTIRKLALTPSANGFSGAVTTVAGTPKVAGNTDGVGSAAGIGNVHSLAFDGDHTLYFSDWGNDSIRSFDLTSQKVTTLATGQPHPRDLTYDAKGTLYFTQDQHTISQLVLPNGAPTVLTGKPGLPGFLDGHTDVALFNSPTGIVYDGAGVLYVADSANNALRKIDLASGEVVTVANQTGKTGSADGSALAAQLKFPFHLARASNGQIIVMDSGNELVRVFNPQSAELSTVLGVAGVFGVRSGPAPGGLNNPQGLGILPSGELLVGDVAEAVVQLGY